MKTTAEMLCDTCWNLLVSASRGFLILLAIWVANMVSAFLIENVITQIPTASTGGFLKAVGSIGVAMAAIKFAQIMLIGKTKAIAQSVFSR